MVKNFRRMSTGLMILVMGFGISSAMAADLVASKARIVLPGNQDTISMPGYVVLENRSDQEIILIKIRSNSFGLSMIHQTVIDRGDRRMMLKPELIIKPKSKVTLHKDGVHFMFAGAKGKLKKGKSVSVNLYLNTGEKMPVEFKLVK